MTEAQRLADHIHCGDDLCKCSRNNAAAELRRLDAREAELAGLLREIEAFMGADFDDLPMAKQVRAAIKAAT